MNFRTLSILRTLALGASLTLLGAGQANAALLTYDFDVAPTEFVQHLDAATVADGRYYEGGGSGQVTYDTVTKALHLVVNSTGTVYGEKTVSGSAAMDKSVVKATNVTSNLDITYTKGVLTNTPYSNGLVTKQSDGTTSGGTISISDVGIAGVGGFTYDVEASFMNFNDAAFANVIAGWAYYQEHAALNTAHGNLSFWQYDSPSLGLSVFSTWLHSVGHVGTNNYCFTGMTGDVHGSGEVPEPATMALLGIGLLGGAAKRRRDRAA